MAIDHLSAVAPLVDAARDVSNRSPRESPQTGQPRPDSETYTPQDVQNMVGSPDEADVQG